jgi:hypothetical protein
MNLVEFVKKHTRRSACKCGRCIDADMGQEHDPKTHTVDVGFFSVSAVDDPSVEELRRLIQEWPGQFGVKIDLLDELPHRMEDIGGWIGSQEIALQLMGLGQLLGLWIVFTDCSLVVTVPNGFFDERPSD